jgi:endonuclease-8
MEGPSLIILREEVEKFRGKKIIAVTGNVKTFDKDGLKYKKVISFDSWGKHFLICFDSFYLKVHFLMFGSYTVDSPKDRIPRLQLDFINGTLYLYTCSIQRMEGIPGDIYDKRTDLMSPLWNSRFVTGLIKKSNDKYVCDLLLNQEIFSGSGNIIKNEVLFRLHMHPLKLVSTLSPAERSALAKETRKYSFDFYKWKKVFMLRKNWQAYKKKICPRCKIPFHSAITGKLKRRSYYCSSCQHK